MAHTVLWIIWKLNFNTLDGKYSLWFGSSTPHYFPFFPPTTREEEITLICLNMLPFAIVGCQILFWEFSTVTYVVNLHISSMKGRYVSPQHFIMNFSNIIVHSCAHHLDLTINISVILLHICNLAITNSICFWLTCK